MRKRDFLTFSSIASLGGLTSYGIYHHLNSSNFPIRVHYPGMIDGHIIRDKKINKENSEFTNSYDLTVIGSGISALVLCWKLLISGYKGKIAMITGSEVFGNSASQTIDGKEYPTGAHYLPLQNEESTHTRELLHFFNIIKDNPYSEKPTYNEDCLVFSPMERFLNNQEWMDGLYVKNKNIEEFFKFIQTFKNKIGNDNKKLFAIPSTLSSRDSKHLDIISFKTFIDNNNFTDPELINHLNYCCKDDYGQTIEHISAWAGIHYFAGRTGKCSNINHETILTWKNGNAFLAQTIFNFIKDKITVINGSCHHIEQKKPHEIHYIKDKKSYLLKTEKLAVCTPLMMVNRFFKTTIIPTHLIPEHSIWIVSNVLFNSLPKEIYHGTSLAYDNVIHDSENLGFIFSYNQSIDISRENKTLTAYTCLPSKNIPDIRKNLIHKKPNDLFKIINKDLISAYGNQIHSLIKSVDITVRGHAMPYPEVNFLNKTKEVNKILQPLEANSIYFAHSDLSRISIFEEAAWWGYTVAKKIISAKF